MIETTLNKIKACDPCENGWKKLLVFLGKTETDDEPLSLLTILESNGLSDALWALKTVEGMDGPGRLFACYCAKQSLYLFEREYPDNDRLRRVIETAERFARGQATDKELSSACHKACEVAVGVSLVHSSSVESPVEDATWAVAWASAERPFGNAVWETAGTVVKAIAEETSTNKAAVWETLVPEFKRLCTLGGAYEHLS